MSVSVLAPQLAPVPKTMACEVVMKGVLGTFPLLSLRHHRCHVLHWSLRFAQRQCLARRQQSKIGMWCHQVLHRCMDREVGSRAACSRHMMTVLRVDAPLRSFPQVGSPLPMVSWSTGWHSNRIPSCRQAVWSIGGSVLACGQSSNSRPTRRRLQARNGLRCV